MIRMFARRRAQIICPGGQDRVIFALPLPSESRINNIHAEVHIIGINVRAHTVAMAYGIEGYILPVLDPDSGASYETIWDTLVPKDDDVDAIDLDTGASDSQSFYEPGESSMAEVLNVGLQPERIYNRSRIVSFANAALRQEVASVIEYVPAEVVKINVRKNYAVSQPSIVAFALGVADMLDTENNPGNIPAENEWPRLKYMELVLEQALIKLFGLVEAGAETPWEEAAQLLRKHLEPDVHEETAGAWGNDSFYAYVDCVIDHSVKGRMDKLQLGTGG